MTARKTKPRTKHFQVQTPASTSNLGPGFDCFGLSLKLYLTIRATPLAKSSVECRVRTTGARENATLPRNATNLIYRAMAFAAKRESLTLPPVDLAVHNEIPLASGLGSSAAAIVGGIKLAGLLCEKDISDQSIQNYATEFEGHPDNVGAALYGGFVLSCVGVDRNVLSVRFDWPAKIRTVVVSPHSQLPTHVARTALPRTLSRVDAVFNLQRTSLFTAALVTRRFELFKEAMRDRLHQPRRESLVTGLAEALALPDMSGLLGIALSGAGPSIIALVSGNEDEVGARISECFGAHKIRSTVRVLEVANEGLVWEE
ncbi:MAG TPA: homoserine kinase [Pyrinomonadaceae bacterium]|nr:homoserine kinase [Pyrinomonadaceae bacterium]